MRFGGILDSFFDLIFSRCFVVLQRLLNLRRRHKDGSLRIFYVQSHAEFASMPNSADLWVFWVCCMCVFVRVLCVWLSIAYQFGLLLYCSLFSVIKELNKFFGTWFHCCVRLIVFLVLQGHFVLFLEPDEHCIWTRFWRCCVNSLQI